MRMIPIETINEGLDRGGEDYIRGVDCAFEEELRRVAVSLRDGAGECPIVLLSGPSGSGKTTSALMLEKMLDNWGHETHVLSMDNYFRSLSEEEQAMAADGRLDLESPSRVDEVLLSEQLEKMVRCQPVSLPMYDFKAARRVDSGRVLTRKPGEIVIVEGIHALNPAVIQVPDSETVKIYVSVRTRVSSGNTVLHPAKIRLLRRMLRDRNGRGRTPAETIRLFDNVERGKNRYIMPFKGRADYDIDTFMAYELGVYREAFMEELSHVHGFPGMEELLTVLRRAVSVPESSVPKEALIREFIGRGQFKY